MMRRQNDTRQRNVIALLSGVLAFAAILAILILVTGQA